MDNVTVWIFLYLILPVALGILGNLVTPWVKYYFDKGSLSLRERRIKALIEDYRWTKTLKEDNRFLILSLARLAMAPRSIIIILLLIIGSTIINPVLYGSGSVSDGSKTFSRFVWIGGTAITTYALMMVRRRMTEIENSYKFGKYRNETIQKLRKLGGSPEDLDQEEIEGG